MKNFALALTLFVGLFFLVGVSSPVQAQCGTNMNPNNTCTGSFSGFNVSTGTNNSFFGNSSGQNNTSGDSNAFFGSLSGLNGVTSRRNSYFGAFAGTATTSSNNAFFGTQAGYLTTTGGFNSFFGDGAGGTNTTGSYNSFFGRGADSTSPGISFATAIGAGSKVSSNNTIQLGRDGFDVTRIGKMGTAGATPLCLNAAKELSTCAPVMMAKADNTDELKFEIRKQNRIIGEQADALRVQQGQIEALRNTLCSMNSKAAICRQ